MFSQRTNDIGFSFSVNINGRDIPFKEWGNTDDCIYYFPLSNLVDNGYAKFNEIECTVPYENIYLLDEEERIILGLPRIYDKAIRLRGKGLLNSSQFTYKVEFLSHVPDGELLACEKTGNVITNKGDKYLLSESQYALINHIETYNSVDESEKNTDFNLRQFAEIKELASMANCQLDSYLKNENVYVPDKIKIEIGKDEEGFTINPAVNIDENDKFQKAFEKLKKVQGQYPLQRDNGERMRVVLNPEQKENLGHLKGPGGRHKTREEIRAIARNPTEYFDPDVFDLSELYSDRVIEIGVYKPKFYPFICPYKSCWVVGANIETPQNGTTKIMIENRDELFQLNGAIEHALKHNEEVVYFKDTQIGLDDACFLLQTAQKQFNSPKEPIMVAKEQIDASRKVLIIEDNAEDVRFAADERIFDKNDRYTLYKDSFLNDEFQLKSHQKEGVAWLQYLHKNRASGCLMADDMGLGKTLQILYFLDWHSRNYRNHKPYLIVAPVSLIENWINEYKRFFKAPRLNISILTSKNIPRRFDKNIVDMIQDMDLILTNYESLRISQLNFCAVDFEMVVLDEAQKIKSPGTMVTNAAKALKSSFKIAVTGTPVENTLLDLWCIMDFCVPGLLGNAKAFATKYQNPLKNKDSDIITLGNEVHEKLGIYFLRRLKKDAASELPAKREFKEKVIMPTYQEGIYRNVINDYLSGKQSNMLVTIMDIREVSEHPHLYNSTISNHHSDDLINTSARLQATITFLDNIKSKNEKAIIFAERKETQKMLQRIFYERYGIVTKIINGDTPSIVLRQTDNRQSRQISIDEFQSSDGFNVIIMSPLAAGMGLNVTAANHVIHYSRHWNPAKESQATDRAYRIGQKKDVSIYYPMAVSNNFKSFDETLDDLLTRKSSLATSTIFPTERIEVKIEDLSHVLFGA